MTNLDSEFRKRLIVFLNDMGSYKEESAYSSIWSNFIREFTIGENDKDSLKSYYRTQCRGYVPKVNRGGLDRLRERGEDLVGWFVHFLYSAAEAAAKPLKGKRIRYEFDWRTYRTKRFLKSCGIDYQTELRVCFPIMPLSPSFFSLRAVYYQHLLLQHVQFRNDKPRRILEVGAGVGTLAVMLARKLKPMEYVVLDLPEMLPVFAVELRQHYPECRIVFPNEDHTKLGSHDEVTFILRTPMQLDSIQDESVDLALNIDSFAEMPVQSAHVYVELFNRVLAPGGYMFLANRESRVHKGAKLINSMWTLPYDANQEILLFDHCPMRYEVMGGRTLNINRISQK